MILEENIIETFNGHKAIVYKTSLKLTRANVNIKIEYILTKFESDHTLPYVEHIFYSGYFLNNTLCGNNLAFLSKMVDEEHILNKVMNMILERAGLTSNAD